MDIPPKSSKSFSLLLKYKHEADCYAFNAQNYIDGFPADLRVEDRKMPQGSYISKITVKGDNAEASTKFLVRNSGPEFLDLFILKMKIWSVSNIATATMCVMAAQANVDH